MFVACVYPPTTLASTPLPPQPWWPVQSIDTMKYSRDAAGEMLNNPSFDAVIDQQVSQIAETGATYVAIATPYDDMFLPFLKRWVAAARKHGLHIWFRGNFSGWEGWYNQPKISRQEHLQKLSAFIPAHPELFADGDIFSACPECENGGPGDPRHTGDVDGHRQFLLAEHQVAQQAFAKMGKNVHTEYNSMNADVARLIMDPKTTQALGGLVVIDHYVASPQKLAKDIVSIARSSQGNVFLGEFGAPIPDIHGNMTQNQQKDWINQAFQEIVDLPELTGVNYWVNVGGSTELWSAAGTPRAAVAVIHQYFSPPVFAGLVTDMQSHGIPLAQVQLGRRSTTTDNQGAFQIPYQESGSVATVSAIGYFPITVPVSPPTAGVQQVQLESIEKSLLTKAWGWLLGLVHSFSFHF